MKIKLTHTRDTKGTHLFTNDTIGAPIKALYVKKGSFEGEVPARIVVTVETDDE